MSGTPAPTGAPSYDPEPASIGVRWSIPDGADVSVLINHSQLRGQACMLCTRTDGRLEDAGHAYTEQGGWRAKVCSGGCLAVAA